MRRSPRLTVKILVISFQLSDFKKHHSAAQGTLLLGASTYRLFSRTLNFFGIDSKEKDSNVASVHFTTIPCEPNNPQPQRSYKNGSYKKKTECICAGCHNSSDVALKCCDSVVRL